MKGSLITLGIALSLLCSCSTVPKQTQSDVLMLPELAKNQQQAPDDFKVRFICSNGEFVVESHREWSPLGVDRFYNLVKNGYFENSPFYRVVPGFLIQFGMNAESVVTKAWDKMEFADEPTQLSNLRGTLSYASRGPNTRTTHLVISTVDNSRLDGSNAVMGKVIEGMDVVDGIFSDYGDMADFGGNSPDFGRMVEEGCEFLEAEYPKLDFILSTELVE